MNRIVIKFFVFSFLLVSVTACDQAQSIVAPKKSIGNCLAESIKFYASGGSTFDEGGCNVSTGRNNNGGIWISASDVHEDMDRTMSVWMPANWLNVDASGYQTIVQEYDVFMSCFQPQSEPQGQNPLQKQTPVNNGCSQYSLTVNGVPGVGIENKKSAPHFRFQALKKQ